MRLGWIPGSVLILIIAAVAPVAPADVRMPGIFGDNMVLQSDQPVPVWGWGHPGEKVTVTFADQTRTATVDADGNWSLTLDALAAGTTGPFDVQGENRITFNNVICGEVWICAGQSNMAFTVSGVKDEDRKEIFARPSEPQIRLFTVDRVGLLAPAGDVRGRWQLCDASMLRTFSAVGYCFAYQLHQWKHEPVGMINASVGGSRAEAWTALPDLRANAALTNLVEKFQAAYDQFTAGRSLEEAQAAWQQDIDAFHAYFKAQNKIGRMKDKAAVKEFETHLGRAMSPMPPPVTQTPAMLYNGLIHGLRNYAVRGVLWYQGESNAWAGQYEQIFTTMIQSWRHQWGRDDLPFLFVQLPGYREVDKQPASHAPWANLRNEQWRTAQHVPHCYMTSIVDMGEMKNIHPKDKRPVAHRLLLNARANVYGDKDVVWTGPHMEQVTFDGDKAIVSFDPMDAKLTTRDGQPPRGFAIAADDKHFVWADAEIHGNIVILHSDQIAHPVAVRYGWAMFPNVNLANEAGLPALPFRTDTW